MSKIEDLIKQYCPNRVVWKNLKDIAEIGTGSSNRADATKEGAYPFYVRSKEVLKISNFEFDEEAIIIPGEGGIGDIFHYIKGKYALHQRAYRIHFLIKELNVKFAYYYMMAKFKTFIFSKAVNATVTSIRKPMVENFKIPIPPLPVQEEIVRILDAFSSLEAGLEAELEAELEARKKQYEHYRNKLLTFDENSMRRDKIKFKNCGKIDDLMKQYCPNGVEYKRIEQVCDSIIAHKKLNKRNYLKAGTYPIIDQGQQFIVAYTDDPSAIVPQGNYVIFGDHTRSVKFVNFPFAQGADGLKILKSCKQILPKYLYYSMLNLDIPSRGYNRHWTIVKEMTIPVPPLPIQEEIVAILDKFDSLVNDISEGLPAELNARRQQYEYYRNKLLTFDEAA